MRNANAVLLILTALVANSCGVRRPLEVTSPVSVIQRTTWVAVERPAGTFTVLAKSNAAMVEAMSELCPKSYICFGPESLGEALTVERKKK